ncbi:MAG: DUF5666 domain-containing protein [Opitutales bacterium]
MKTITQNIALLSFLATLGLTLRAGEPAVGPSAGMALRPTADESAAVVSGKVTAKSATQLTVDSKSVAINPATTFLKEGKSITADDLKVGDSVKVATAMGDDGALVAVTVTVQSGES